MGRQQSLGGPQTLLGYTLALWLHLARLAVWAAGQLAFEQASKPASQPASEPAGRISFGKK